MSEPVSQEMMLSFIFTLMLSPLFNVLLNEHTGSFARRLKSQSPMTHHRVSRDPRLESLVTSHPRGILGGKSNQRLDEVLVFGEQIAHSTTSAHSEALKSEPHS